MPQQKKILILTASPDDKARLHTNQEIKAIEQELERSKNQDKFEIIFKLAVTPEDLIRVLRNEKPEIVHFCGHGKKTGLVLENELGEAQTVRAEALARLFKQFKDEIKCVLLNSCYSEVQAKAINEHIQYVIGMSGQIEDTAAIKFAVNFYATLIAGRSYEDAYEFGRIALDLLGIQDDLLPVFLEKSQPIPPRPSPNLPTTLHYSNVISAFKDGRAIPFLGPGINFCDEQPLNQIISDIKLADYLARDLGEGAEDLVGAPCPVCLVSAEDLPNDCPVKKASLEGTTEACHLAKEQALAVAQQNLQCLAQYMKLHYSIQTVYQKLKIVFEWQYRTNKLHQFFATLPREMQAKGYNNLPYQLLVTTNYDDMLERAFRAANQPYDLVFYVAEGAENRGRFQYKPYEQSACSIPLDQEVLKKDRPVILKLYGAVLYGTVKNFVITEDHHINYLVYREIEQLLPKDILEILWKSHNILFMGYSPKDVNLRLIVNRLWGEREIGKRSWMIHQSKPGELDKEFWRNRKVTLLDSNLKDYVTELNQRIEALMPKKSPYELWRQ